MYYTDDPINDWNNHCAEQERELGRLPICRWCKRRIEDDYLFEINGDLIHQSCFEKQHLKLTENFME